MGEGTIAATMGQRKKLKHTEGSYLSNAVPQAACCVLHQQAERTAKAEPKNNNNDKKKKKKNWNDSEKAICYLEEFKGFKKMIFDQSFLESYANDVSGKNWTELKPTACIFLPRCSDKK